MTASPDPQKSAFVLNYSTPPQAARTAWGPFLGVLSYFAMTGIWAAHSSLRGAWFIQGLLVVFACPAVAILAIVGVVFGVADARRREWGCAAAGILLNLAAIALGVGLWVVER